VLAAIRAIWKVILPEFRLRFVGLAGMSILVALLETLGVASVMPLVAVLVAPDSISQNKFIRGLLTLVGVGTTLPPVHVIGGVTITLFVMSNAASLALNWWSIQFTSRLMTSLSQRLGRADFRQPFAFFLRHPAAELANLICNEVAKVGSGGVLQLCMVLSRGASLLLVLGFLLLISPAFTSLFVCLVALLYALIYRQSARRIAAAGTQAIEASGCAFTAATEMYSMAREILLRDDCTPFLRRVSAALTDFYHADAVARILPTLPKYAMEIASVCVLFAVPIYRSIMGEDARAELPLLATFAYAGFRMLPLLQQVYASLTILRYHLPMAQRLDEVSALDPEPRQRLAALDQMPPFIELKGLSYRYPGSATPAIAGISFNLLRGERVAIVGASGAGKSTLVDIVLGLLVPTAGSISFKGAQNELAWKAGVVGYVPQSPLILNASIARNIAFGKEDDEIDLARCREAASKAEIDQVIEALRGGYHAVIGRDVLNLSGGERQRLAIARALYSKPALLVLDEPGAALDPPTSRKIFELLCSRGLGATVLIVTHDIEYLADFDKIIFMEKGNIVSLGSYAALVEECPEFRRFEGALVEQQRQAG
jgi:ATP-binding cassette, subfamily B, bacterial PglK